MRSLRSIGLALIAVLSLSVASPSAQAQPMASYYAQYDFLSAPPAAFDEGLLGFANPALPAVQANSLQLLWSTDGRDHGSVQNWGAFTSLGGFSGSVTRIRAAGLQSTGYHVGLAGGDRRFAVGVGYQGFTGDSRALGRVNRLTTGFVSRPSRYLSVGGVYNIGLETSDREFVAEVGVRPLGSPRLTVFADAALFEGDAIQDAPWSVGASAEVISGLEVVGRYFENETFTAGLRLSLGRLGASSQARFDTEQDYASSTYGIRLGSHVPSAISDAIDRDRSHVTLELTGSVRYQQSRLASFSGDAPPRFYEILRVIEQAAASDRVRQVALNLSGLQIQPALAWELRESLKALQARGKTVLVYIDNAGMNTYHIASVADHVIMDATGRLTLPGYAASQTFFAETLDQIGLQVDDWRLFSHKSALESFDRTDFSEAEREQRQDYIDAFYETVRSDVIDARGLSADAFDALVDTQTILWAREAEEAGLIDATGRWEDGSELLSEHAGVETSPLSSSDLNEIQTATREWGAPPVVAVVYGIGGTSLDSGMRARALRETIRDAAERSDVRAIVFRVDSPGGDPLAADLVAEALRDASEKKPVIISQGQVAASGGYWVSMYGDEVYASPTTLTGSIGVVAGWFYDDGFSERAGFDYDVVQRGDRADLFTGYQLPLLGVQIPTRPLSDEERERAEAQIMALYDDFVTRVAEGRGLSEDQVRDAAEGRVWTGPAAQDRDLVDTIGGLDTAIEAAHRAAGLDPARTVVQEVNAISGFFGFGRFIPAPIDSWLRPDPPALDRDDPMVEYLRLMIEHQPHPLVLMPPSMMPVSDS
ncbi:MAG: S49 family peptidase [Longimonas sp.]|uniref:S49 family peptidase n=1 Tax=Longimonas sp. TaxID=2039626 RepID=UPI0033586348